MSQPALFLCMFRPKDAWWDLTDEEKQQFGKAIGDSLDAAICKQIVNAL